MREEAELSSAPWRRGIGRNNKFHNPPGLVSDAGRGADVEVLRKMEPGRKNARCHMELGPLPRIYESLCLMCFYYYIYILAPRNVNRDKGG